jgi:hypothetical protein
LEDGTPVKLRLQRTLSSADAQVDDRVDFDVLEEVNVNDVLVIPKGSVAWGTITAAESKKRMARGGKLNVNIDAVRLADGEKCALRAVKEVKGGGHTGAMTGGIVASAIVLWPAAPFFLFMHGKDITIPKGTEITAYINGDMSLDLVKFAGGPTAEAQAPPIGPTATVGLPSKVPEPPGQTQTPPVRPTAAAESTTLAVKSTPDGADITVDGKYKGSTPSSLRVQAGDHSVSVEKSGFKKWQRTVSVDAGSNIGLDMTLEPDQSTNIVQVPSNPPVSATQPHEVAQIALSASDIQERQPTGPATGESATEPIKNAAGTVQTGGEQGMTGTFEGEVRNDTLGVTAGYEINVREENGGIYGCSTVQTSLSGSGSINGSVNGSRVVFETDGKKLRIRFIGELQGDEIKGTYTVLSTPEHGGFVLKRTNYNAPPFGFDTKKCRKD